MLTDWNMLSDQLQLVLSREALRRATLQVAEHADTLAEQMESGILADRGGPDALRLLAALLRVTGEEAEGPVGHA
jgi:hypothetical protein